MTALEVRELLARTVIERALIRKYPDLSDRMLVHLVGAAAECGAFRYHLASGTPLLIAEVVGEAERSEVGLLIFAARKRAEKSDDLEVATQSLAERMERARRQPERT